MITSSLVESVRWTLVKVPQRWSLVNDDDMIRCQSNIRPFSLFYALSLPHSFSSSSTKDKHIRLDGRYVARAYRYYDREWGCRCEDKLKGLAWLCTKFYFFVWAVDVNSLPFPDCWMCQYTSISIIFGCTCACSHIGEKSFKLIDGVRWWMESWCI